MVCRWVVVWCVLFGGVLWGIADLTNMVLCDMMKSKTLKQGEKPYDLTDIGSTPEIQLHPGSNLAIGEHEPGLASSLTNRHADGKSK